MLGLILDTSTEHSLLALSKNNKLIDSSILPHGQNLSQSLLPSIHQLVLKNNISLKDLFHISIGIGPGSYTGTRIGLATAESLALALDIPLYPFCSLLAFLPPHLPQGPFAFITNTKHPTWFALIGYFHEGSIEPSYRRHILSKQDLRPFLEDIPSLLTFPTSDLTSYIPELLSKGSRQLYAEPNFASLMPYLAHLHKSSPEKPEIVYLQDF